jgi:hypothetical protein
MIWFAFRWRNCPESGPPVAITAGESAGARSPTYTMSDEHHLHGYATSTLAQLAGSRRRRHSKGQPDYWTVQLVTVIPVPHVVSFVVEVQP